MNEVLLIGFGVEGRAAARYFLNQGVKVIAADAQAPTLPCPAEFAGKEGFTWSTEEDAVDHLRAGVLVLRSPGIIPSHPLVHTALDFGLEVTTPTGYWLGHLARSGTLTVTGSKGKSTTVTLAVSLMTHMGHEAAPHGNIGLPPLDHPPASAMHPVLELSSYMLHDAPPGPYLHLVTNLFREHTPWHGSEEDYHDAKLRPFRFPKPCHGLAPREVIRTHNLGEHVSALEDIVPLDDQCLMLDTGTVCPGDIDAAFADGPLLLALRAAAAAVIKLTGMTPSPEDIRNTVTDYQGLPSRQEVVPSSDGRTWVNDALATIPEATLHALDRFADRDVTLLLGGADREQRLDSLANWLAFHPRVRPLVFGSVSQRMIAAFDQAGATYTLIGSYEDAIEEAKKMTPPGGVILFSPSAASEPPHNNFTVRADLFRAAALVV